MAAGMTGNLTFNGRLVRNSLLGDAGRSEREGRRNGEEETQGSPDTRRAYGTRERHERMALLSGPAYRYRFRVS